MEDREVFKANCRHWMITNPTAAEQLENLNCDTTTFCKTEKEERNLKRNDGLTYHARKGALDEAKEWFSTLDLRGIDTLIVYGVGLGYYYQAAKEWLTQDQRRSLVFLEDDLEVIHRLFELEVGSALLKNRQVHLFSFEKVWHIEMKESDLFTIPLFFFMGNLRFSALNSYAQQFADFLPILENQIEYIRNYKGFQLMEYMNYGDTFFQNFYSNMFQLPSSYLADNLFNAFSGIPAIILGAGPSLEKNRELVETLAEKALIFAGGSSLNTLSIHGFNPHFGVSIDPNWNQYARLFMNQAFAVPFFYRNRIFPQALSLIQAERLFVPGSGGHQVAAFFEKKLNFPEKERIPEGNSVVNFSVAIAEALGCNPIIFVGVDLAYTDDFSYARGIINHPILDMDKSAATRGARDEIIVKKDIFGQPIKTLWKWISEALWISQLAITSPRRRFINATEGGIGFEGIPNIPLKEVIEKHLQTRFDLQSFIHGEIQNAPLPKEVTKENISAAIEELEDSFRRCTELCKQLRKEFHHVLKEVMKTETAPETLITDQALNALKNLHQEVAYEYILGKFNSSFSTFFGEKDRDIMGLENLALTKRRLDMNKKRYEFLKAVCQESIGYIRQALEAEELKRILSETFAKELNQTKAAAEEQKEVYEITDELWRIVDAELNLCYEMPALQITSKEMDPIKYFGQEKTDGGYQLLYPDGKVKFVQYYREGNLHGPTSYHDKRGALLARSWFVRGLRQGKTYFYYPDGALHSCQRFLNGKRHGMQQYFYRNGKIQSQIPYKEDLIDGTVTLFYSDGFKKREIRYRKGKREGLEIVWNIGGIKEFEGSYREDRPCGVFRSWYPFGKLAREITYDEEGQKIDVKGFDIDGKPLPSAAVLRKDYFDLIHEETDRLTSSLDGVFQEVENLTRDAVNQKFTGIEEELPDFSQDLQEIRKEMENLKSINSEIGVEADAVSSQTVEALWKNPETRRLLAEHIKEANFNIAEDIGQLEKVLRLTIKALADQGKKRKK